MGFCKISKTLNFLKRLKYFCVGPFCYVRIDFYMSKKDFINFNINFQQENAVQIWSAKNISKFAPCFRSSRSKRKREAQSKVAIKTLPDSNRTQAIDFVSWVYLYSWNENSCRDKFMYRFNTLGPLCHWECFFYKFGHQVALLALVTSLATKRCHSACQIALLAS